MPAYIAEFVRFEGEQPVPVSRIALASEGYDAAMEEMAVLTRPFGVHTASVVEVTPEEWANVLTESAAAAKGTEALRCGFCGEEPTKGRTIFCGNAAAICEACLELSMSVIAEGDPDRFDAMVAAARALAADRSDGTPDT